MNSKNKISASQIRALVVTVVIGTGVLSLPSDIAGEMGNSGWLGILIGGLISTIFVIIINKIFHLNPGREFEQVGVELLGSFLFKIYLIVFLAYFILLLSTVIRDFSEVVKVYLLETTPQEIVIITGLLAASYMARSEIEVLARMAVVIYPIVLVIPLALFLVTLPVADYTNLFPLFTFNFSSLLRGVLAGLFSYGGYEFLLLSIPAVENQRETLKYSTQGMLTVIAIYLLMFVVSLAQYGIHQLRRGIWPSIAIVKEISLPGFFLENLDGIVVAAWTMVIFATLGPVLHFSGVVLKEILNAGDHKYLILPLLPIIYIISQYYTNLPKFAKGMGRIIHIFSILVLMAMPSLLLILALIKKRRES